MVPPAVVALIASSCGLADYPFVAPPLVISQDALSAQLFFENNPANNPEFFEGFDIYYRFYLDTEEDAQQEDRSEIESQSEAFVDTRRLLEDFEYRRMQGHPVGSPGDVITQEPLLPVAEAAKKEQFPVTVDFQPLQRLGSTQEPTISYTDLAQPTTVVPLRKPSAASEAEAFDPALFTTDDADMPDDYRGNEAADFILSLFVVSYGKQDLVVSIYSRPEYLGRVTFKVQ
jgi:hypothetical protein